MKKILVFIVICFIVNVNAFAQLAYNSYEYREKIRFGVKIGGQVTAINKVHVGSNKRFPGLTIGATAQVPLSYWLFFAPELMYSQEGEKSHAIDGTKTKFFQDYLAHLILLKGYFGGQERLFLELGPKLSYMINSKNKELDFGDYNKYDFGLCLGGGLNLGRNNNFEIGARIYMGLIDIYPYLKHKNINVAGSVTFAYFLF